MGGATTELFERVEGAMGRGGLATNYRRKGRGFSAKKLAIGREDLAGATRASLCGVLASGYDSGERAAPDV